MVVFYNNIIGGILIFYRNSIGIKINQVVGGFTANKVKIIPLLIFPLLHERNGIAIGTVFIDYSTYKTGSDAENSKRSLTLSRRCRNRR